MKKNIVKRKIADLKPHPRQAEIFSDLNKPQIAALAENIRVNGLLQPIEILPDGTILCGHQRVQAIIFLGWNVIDVWVRDDLVELGNAACEERLIEDNLDRRQLSGLGRARCYKRLKELENNRPAGQCRKHIGGDVRDVIAEKLGCSGRTADRYLRVLETPLDVQNSFDRGEISLVNAGKVAGLNIPVQQEIAAKIRSGENAKNIVADTLKKHGRRRRIYKILHELEDALRRCGPELHQRMTEIVHISSLQYKNLCQSRDLLEALIKHADELAMEKNMQMPA